MKAASAVALMIKGHFLGGKAKLVMPLDEYTFLLLRGKDEVGGGRRRTISFRVPEKGLKAEGEEKMNLYHS